MSKKYRQKLGKQGENIATHYYRQQGWQIIQRNYYTRYGELDLVIKRGAEILVVEVKARTNDNFGWAEESIDERKLAGLEKSYQILQIDKRLPDWTGLELCLIKINQNKAKIRRIRL